MTSPLATAVDALWDGEIVSQRVDYIRISAKSPHFVGQVSYQAALIISSEAGYFPSLLRVAGHLRRAALTGASVIAFGSSN